jgi:hypothetical protein
MARAGRVLSANPDGGSVGGGLLRDRDALASHASRARHRSGTTECTLDVGGVRIRLVAAGSTLPDVLWPALVAAPPPSGSDAGDPTERRVDATIELWDAGEAGAPLPALSLFTADPASPGSTYRSEGSIEAWFQPIESAISLADHATNRAWYCVRSTGDLPVWEAGAPLRAVLRWVLADHGLHLVHAAGIGVDDRGVVLTGRGGSGKSTTTALCAASGFSTVGDDYVVVDPVARTAHALYRTTKLDPRLVDQHPAFAGTPARTQPRVEVGAGVIVVEKRMLWLDDLDPGCLVPTLPIDAILLPRVVHEAPGTELTRSTAAAALRALAPSTMLQLPGRRGGALAAMHEIAAAAPVHDLALGTDLDAVAPTIGRFLDGIDAATTIEASTDG